MTIRRNLISAAVCTLLAGPVFSEGQWMEVYNIADGDTLNVRDGAGANFKDIGDLQEYEFIRVLGYDDTGKWAQIRYRGQMAYVSAKYLRAGLQSDGLSTSLGPHYVTGIAANDPDGGLVVRDDGDPNGQAIDVLSNGTNVHVIQRSNNGKWAMISYGGQVGWVGSAYLSNEQTIAPEPMPSATPQTAPDGGSLPASYVVAGVASNDVLNMRDTPSTDGNILGGFAPGQTVQVLGMASGNWAKVTDGTREGYVNITYMTRSGGGQSGNITTTNGFPLGITCNGTEPFWTLDIADDRTVTYTSLIEGQAPLTSVVQTTPAAGGGYPFDFSAPPYSGTINQIGCSDGMSETYYTMSITLNMPPSYGSMNPIYGCCNMN